VTSYTVSVPTVRGVEDWIRSVGMAEKRAASMPLRLRSPCWSTAVARVLLNRKMAAMKNSRISIRAMTARMLPLGRPIASRRVVSRRCLSTMVSVQTTKMRTIAAATKTSESAASGPAVPDRFNETSRNTVAPSRPAATSAAMNRATTADQRSRDCSALDGR
jgi:hypothetical protein